MRRLALALLLPAALVAILAPAARAHCEIPCGIYGDRMRIDMLYENIRTVEKSMASIGEGSHADAQAANQLVRWIHNKEQHAEAIQEIVDQYFLRQRVKFVAAGEEGRERYLAQLTSLHQLTVEAMKAKQTVDPAHVAAMRELVDRFASHYFSAEELAHIREHHGAE